MSQAPLRIIHTEASVGWGGQENRTLNEMIAMRQRGHELAVVSRPGARLVARAQEEGFQTFEIDMRSVADFPAIVRLRRLFRDFGADIVNTHSGRDTQLAGLAARTLGKRRPKVVRTRHLALPITSRFTYSILPDHVVSVSDFVRGFLIEAGVPAEKITAVPTGIDLTRYDAERVGELRTELGLPESSLLVGTVAILRKKKGHTEILDAVPEVLRQFPHAHFVFAGDGPQFENLKRRIDTEGLGTHVHLLGLRRDVINVLASLDLFVLPTYQEALGTAFAEAGAMGLPVVATNVDGVPEVVSNGNSGLLVPAKDSGAIAKSICELLGDPLRREQFGLFAHNFVRQRFSRDVMAEGMERVYMRLLGT